MFYRLVVQSWSPTGSIRTRFGDREVVSSIACCPASEIVPIVLGVPMLIEIDGMLVTMGATDGGGFHYELRLLFYEANGDAVAELRSVPEPASWTLLAVGIGAIALGRRWQ